MTPARSLLAGRNFLKSCDSICKLPDEPSEYALVKVYRPDKSPFIIESKKPIRFEFSENAYAVSLEFQNRPYISAIFFYDSVNGVWKLFFGGSVKILNLV